MHARAAGLSIITTTFEEGPNRNRALAYYTATGASGLVLDVDIEVGNPADSERCIPMLNRHKAFFRKVPRQASLDGGYASRRNLDEAKASEVPRWRESSAFTPLERDVMEYAEAMSETPPRVTDELSARLLERLGAPAMVELTASVAFANMYTRSNTAMGIESQGFSKACELPLAQPSAGYAPSR